MSKIELINASCADQTVDAVTPTAFNELFDAYYNSLKVQMENGYHSISFPLISSGKSCDGVDKAVPESVSEVYN